MAITPYRGEMCFSGNLTRTLFICELADIARKIVWGIRKPLSRCIRDPKPSMIVPVVTSRLEGIVNFRLLLCIIIVFNCTICSECPIPGNPGICA